MPTWKVPVGHQLDSLRRLEVEVRILCISAERQICHDDRIAEEADIAGGVYALPSRTAIMSAEQT